MRSLGLALAALIAAASPAPAAMSKAQAAKQCRAEYSTFDA